MLFFRILKKIENKTNFLIDLSLFKAWNKIVSLSLPKKNIRVKFDFQQIISLICEEEKGSLLLVGNSSPKFKYGSKVDNFDGDVARFNRFQNSHKEYIGNKTTYWFVASNIFDERKYYSNNIDKITQSYPNLKVCLMTDINSEIEVDMLKERIADEHLIKVVDTRAIITILKNLTIQYIQQNGKLITPDNDTFLKKNGYIKPGTGLLTILYGIMNYKKIFIHNFDFFRSNHYWANNLNYGGNDSDGKLLKDIDVDKLVIGAHEFLFEEALINQMVSKGLVQWLV